jgi:HSP20 family molecular chaperone IbpA
MLQEHFLSPTVKDTKEAWLIEMDMPGVEKEKVEVQALGRLLEVRGERQRGEGTVTYKERFRLPDHLRSVENVSAALNLGVLTITIPKQAALPIPVN